MMQRAFSNQVYGEAQGGKTGGGDKEERDRQASEGPVNSEPKQEVRPSL